MGVDLLPGMGKQKYWQAERWTPRHTLVVLQHLAGYTNTEIAEQTGYTPAKVSIIINDERAKVVIAENIGKISDTFLDVNLRMKFLAHEALDEIVDEMRSDPNSRVRQKAAFGILDRAGYSPVQKNLNLSKEDANPALLSSVSDRVEKVMERLEASDASEISYSSPPKSEE